MWVRSQNKNLLLKCSEFTFSHHKILNKDYYHIETEHFPNGTCTTLGCYSTKEKALKVLDMIQKHISRNKEMYRRKEFDEFDNSTNEHVIVSGDDVFQMPQDDEV